MKLFVKIFLCCTVVISIVFQFAGYLLLTYSYENIINREKEFAVNQYQYNKFIVQSKLYTNADNFKENISSNHLFFEDLADDLNGQAAFFTDKKELLFSNIADFNDFTQLPDISNEKAIYKIQKMNHGARILVYGKVTLNEVPVYLFTSMDISDVMKEQELMMERYQKIYVFIIIVSMAGIFVLSTVITRPIKKLTKAADRIVAGNYDERLKFKSKDEIGELAGNFNRMVSAIEDKISELSDNAQQKEDFVANFAHELKTPLTSVIGYADMLYQKDMTTEEVKNAAWYILSEGLRLEALSLKLMDLIVLNKQDFVLDEMPANEVLENVSLGLAPMFDEQNIKFYLDIESVYIQVEYDLLKTLLLNLINNSINAGSTDICLSGKKEADLYCISVCDNGHGIPKDEIKRITEAFYTVDKSRTRKRHGAGLGLALAVKIAEIHKSKLIIESKEKKGTTVKFYLTYKGDKDE